MNPYVQPAIMGATACFCFLSAAVWAADSQYAAALAFVGFGFGCVALGIVFA